MPRPSRQSEPGAVGRLILSTRPDLSALFQGYAIPGDDASDLLREAVELLIVHCHRLARPREFFLRSLEDLCAAYAERRAAEEGSDDDTPEA
jgi:hypothetical protein